MARKKVKNPILRNRIYRIFTGNLIKREICQKEEKLRDVPYMVFNYNTNIRKIIIVPMGLEKIEINKFIDN